jgi:hypothetical protein
MSIDRQQLFIRTGFASEVVAVNFPLVHNLPLINSLVIFAVDIDSAAYV